MGFKPAMPDPRRDPAPTAVLAMFMFICGIWGPQVAPRLMFEQNEMFDLRRELCRSKVFWAENGDGLTKYLSRKGKNMENIEKEVRWTG